MPLAKLSAIETRIQKFYDKLNIHYPQEIDLDRICDNLGIRVLYGAVRSQSFLDSKIIFVDDRLPLNEQREEFAHELVHIWLHSGSQLVLPEPFIRAEESPADRTAMYLLIPTRFLERELDQVDFEKGLRRTGQSPAPTEPTAPSIRPLDHLSSPGNPARKGSGLCICGAGRGVTWRTGALITRNQRPEDYHLLAAAQVPQNRHRFGRVFLLYYTLRISRAVLYYS